MIEWPDVISGLLRALGFLLLFQAAGTAAFLAIFGPSLTRSRPAITRLGLMAAVLAMVAVTGHSLLDAARMAGDFRGVLNPAMQKIAMISSSGAAFACRMAGLVIVALAFPRANDHTFSTRPARRLALALGVLVAAASFPLTGHTSVSPSRLALAPTLLAHVAIGMFWFGSLLPLYLLSLAEPRELAVRLIAAFSKAAVRSVPLILVAGLVMTALLVPGWSVFTQPYGQLLLLKLALFAILMLLAAANRWRFGRQAGPAFRKAVALEVGLISCVLVVTAGLTEFFSPE
jgi:putative copper resistance protein D